MKTTNKTSPRSWRRCLSAFPVIFLLAAGQTAQADDVIELSFATYYPGTISWADVEHAYMDEIEKRSNGRLKVTKKHWKGLFGAKELQGAVGDGAIDMAWSSPLYTPADNPLRTLLIGGPFPRQVRRCAAPGVYASLRYLGARRGGLPQAQRRAPVHTAWSVDGDGAQRGDQLTR